MIVNILRQQASICVHERRWAEGLRIARKLIEHDSLDLVGNRAGGICARHLDALDFAAECLRRAVLVDDQDVGTWASLGIVYQLQERWGDSVDAFRHSLTLDPDHVMSFNSLALTQKKAGELDLALHNYDAAAKALVRAIVKNLDNTPDGATYTYFETPTSIWLEYARYGAMYLAIEAGVDGMACDKLDADSQPGLDDRLWEDRPDGAEKRVRWYRAKFYYAIQSALLSDWRYANILGNRAGVLELLGRDDEYREHCLERDLFWPDKGTCGALRTFD